MGIRPCSTGYILQIDNPESAASKLFFFPSDISFADIEFEAIFEDVVVKTDFFTFFLLPLASIMR